MPIKTLLKKHRLGKRLLVSVVLFSSLITLVISAIQLFGNYNRHLDFIGNNLSSIEKVHLPSLTASTWAAELDDINRQLIGIANIPDIQYVEIKDQETVIASAGKLQPKNMISRSYPMHYMYKNTQQLVGVLNVQASLENARQQIFDQAYEIIVSNAIKTFIVSAFLLSIFHSLVTRHLGHMATFTQQLTFETLSNNLVLDRKKTSPNREDELAIVVNGINSMRQNLLESIDRLKEERHQYQRLVECAIAIPWEFDLNTWQYTYVGPQCKSISGFNTEDWYKTNFLQQHLHEDDKADVTNTYKKNIAAKQEFQIEYRMIHKDGHIIWIRSDVQIVSDDQQQIKLRGYMFDITVRKLAEISLHQHKTQLEQLVQERTQRLEISNQELEAFCYSVSHDLRSPLRAIDGFSKILLEDFGNALGSEGEEYIRRMRNASQNMGKIIDALLDLSRITRHESETKVVNLSQLCLNAFEKLKSLEQGRSTQIQIQQDLFTTGNETLLTILIDNLVSNAWKYTSKKQDARIEFGCTKTLNDVIYYIKDNGAGFNPLYAQKLFSPFQRMHKATEFEGTGVGLATVYRIVQRHNGTIWADSQVDQGATFYFTLKTPTLTPVTNEQ